MGSGLVRSATFHAPDGPRQFELWGGRVSLAKGSSYTLEEAITSPLRVSRTQGTGVGSFFRSAGMVRKFEQGDLVVTFIETGRIIRQGVSAEGVEGPAIFIVKSTGGYHAEWRPDADQQMCIHQALIPPHILAPFINVAAVRNHAVRVTAGPTRAAFDIIKLLFSNGPDLDDETIRGLVGVFVLTLSRCLDSSFATSAQKTSIDQHFERFVSYVAANIQDPSLSATKAARKLGISARRLRDVTRMKGTTFSSFVCERRLQLARELLVAGSSRKVTEIAMLCGFRTLPSFHRLFKQKYGATPMELARRDRGSHPEAVLSSMETLGVRQAGFDRRAGSSRSELN